MTAAKAMVVKLESGVRNTESGVPDPELKEVEVVTLRDRVQTLLDSEEITQSSLGREAGVSGSAVNQWLKSKYAGDNEALERRLEMWFRQRERREMATAKMPGVPEYVVTPTSLKVLAVLSYAQMAGDLAVIYGGAGVGKTRTLREYSRTNNNVWVTTIMPDSAGVVPCLEEISEAIGLRGLPGMGAARLRREVCRKIRDTHGLLIIDEAQHLNQKALEEIRSLHDSTGTGVILCGNEMVYSRMAGNSRSATFAQLFSRIGKRLRLNRPHPEDVLAMMDVFQVSGAKEREVLENIASKPGALRGVVKTLRLAAMLAAGAAEALTVKHLRSAWRDLAGEEA